MGYEQLALSDVYIRDNDNGKIKGFVRRLGYDEAVDFIIDKHYAGRIPSISVAYGWFIDDKLVAACTFGKPASPSLCRGICGEEYSDCVYELNRLVRVEDLQEYLSQFVAYCLRDLKKNNWIIVSYADTGMHHHGYIYQACNFLYTGCTKVRTDMYCGGGKHSRHASENYHGDRQVRTAKYRYVYFCTSDKKLKKKWMKALNYPILPYPKGDNQNYKLGTRYVPTIIKADKGDNNAN